MEKRRYKEEAEAAMESRPSGQDRYRMAARAKHPNAKKAVTMDYEAKRIAKRKKQKASRKANRK